MASTTAPPLVVVLAGPNGAGKSTTGPRLLGGALRVDVLVNADTIARGLSELHPESVAMAAGRIMMERLAHLAAERRSFAFETTLATRSFAPRLTRLRAGGYRTHCCFLALPSADMAVDRVAARVREGGHDVPQGVVRRRYVRGLRNFFQIYLPLFDSWQVFDNSQPAGPFVLARGRGMTLDDIADDSAWRRLKEVSG